MQGHPTFPGRMSLSSYIRRSSLTVDDHRLSPLTMTVNNRACNQHMKTSNIRMKQISFFLSVLLFLLFFLLLEGPMFYIPYYHEQHHLFLFTQTYLNSHLSGTVARLPDRFLHTVLLSAAYRKGLVRFAAFSTLSS